jgi:hypothetical protein
VSGWWATVTVRWPSWGLGNETRIKVGPPACASTEAATLTTRPGKTPRAELAASEVKGAKVGFRKPEQVCCGLCMAQVHPIPPKDPAPRNSYARR